MEKQWWSRGGVQMSLLLALFVSIPHPLPSAALFAATGSGSTGQVVPSQRASSSKQDKRQLARGGHRQCRQRSRCRTTTKAVAQVVPQNRKKKKPVVARTHKRTPQARSRSQTWRAQPSAREAVGQLVTTSFLPRTAPFSVQLNNERLLHGINSVFVLPGERCHLEVDEVGRQHHYSVRTTLGVTHVGPHRWMWLAPREAGLYPVTVVDPVGKSTVVVNVFVLVPFSRLRAGYLNGYRMGNYPEVALHDSPLYERPRGFIEVTQAHENVFVSPHFQLRQFLCKQESDYPKYLALDSRLLLVLETLLHKVNTKGYGVSTFEIMSGYRTPHYNRAIGNTTTYSRHVWGDAADIFIDENPRDGEMDDLNRDGVIDVRDAAVLYHIVNELYQPHLPRVQRRLTGGVMYQPPVQRLLTGGVAPYRATQSHGPFVHVDVRGTFARWGW
jgi:Peptidase M15